MTNTIDNIEATNEAARREFDDQVEALRTFAVEHAELPFAHLCTAGLKGEGWARERVRAAAEEISYLTAPSSDACYNAVTLAALVEIKLDVIRATDTTRPDGAVAKSLIDP